MADQLFVKSGKTFRYQATADNIVGRGAFGRVFAGNFKLNLNASWEEEFGGVKQAAIKRVEINFNQKKWVNIENDREVVALKELRHPCIVSLFAVEDDDNFRNYVFELCQATLEDFITKKYGGLMPDEVEGLYQMSSGLKFIHEKKMIHRDIKPENVLVHLTDEGKRAMLKISDLGFTKRLKEDGIHYDLASGLKGTEYYMAPELLALRNLTGRVVNKDCTIASDVFAAGCTFFRYLSGGLHPFGKGFDIEVNIMEGKPINATEYGGEPWKTNLLAKMVKFNPKERPSFSTIVKILEKQLLKMVEVLKNNLNTTRSRSSFTSVSEYDGEPRKTNLIAEMLKLYPKQRPSLPEFVQELENYLACSRSSFPSVSGEKSLSPIIVGHNKYGGVKTETVNVGDVQYDRSNLIGKGRFCSVFTGTLYGENVAVKRVQLMDLVDREVINNKKLFNHPNIVQFEHYEKDMDFGYIVLERCDATLEDFIYGKYNKPMPTDEQVLFQLANGLEHIHSRKILYRGVTPQNILISLTEPVQMKWSDFGFSKPVNENGSCSLSGMTGTHNWMSPEELGIVSSKKMTEKKKDDDSGRGSVKSEIFSAGCVFIFFLLRGVHPFGDQQSNNSNIRNNIINDYPVNVKVRLPEENFARPFVLQMIENDPEKRISLRQVIDHLTPLQPTIKLSSLLKYNKKNLMCSTPGTLSLVYQVGKFEGSPLAVKRVPLQDCTSKSFKELKQLNDPNIVHLLHFDENNFYRYYGMELCVASLDQLFLKKNDPRKYKGPIPSDEQFCFQLISGLEFIHGIKLVHGSIKPTNILISSSEDPQIKLSDFGLTTRLDEGHTTKSLICGFLSSQYWLAPELLKCESSDRQFTKESDIFASGSVFFYFLSKGSHLFGDTHEIIPNISKGIQKKTFKTQRQIGYFHIIRWMTTIEPELRSTLPEVTEQMKLLQRPSAISFKKTPTTIGNVEFFTSHKIGEGGQAAVFYGFSKGSAVAVKRIIIDAVEEDKKSIVYGERDSFQKLEHRNIVKLIDWSENEIFLVLALEKCLTSLNYYCRERKVCRIIPMPTDREVLLQMAQGLEYIHSQGLIHRDVKPANILISHDNPAVIKWADFGLSRAVVTGSKTFSWSKLRGTDRWLAPELITATQENKIKGSQKCDIFALGCVFFFFLVPGIHPFGEGDVFYTHTNIMAKNPLNLNRLPRINFAFYIINGMIENDAGLRSKLPDVIVDLQRTIEDNAGKLSLRADV